MTLNLIKKKKVMTLKLELHLENMTKLDPEGFVFFPLA